MKPLLLIGARRLTPLVAAIVLFALVVQLLGYSGPEVIADMAKGSAGTPNALLQSVRWSLPLIMLGLGALVSFRSGFFNVGGLGQFYLGAIAGTAVANGFTGLPAPIHITLALIAGILAGAIWSVIPGVLRIVVNADEVVTTIMANFIAALLLQYMVAGPMKDTSGTGQGATSRPIDAALRVSGPNGVSPITITVVLAVIAIIALLIYKTRFGVLSGIAGRNPATLAWQGVAVKRIGIQAFAVTGALSGLAGVMEILGPTGRLAAGLSPEVGNTAMLVALVAGLAVFGAVAAAIFFGALTAASLFLPVVAGLPSSAIAVLNGLIAILVTATLLFPLQTRRRKAERPAPAPTPAGAATAKETAR